MRKGTISIALVAINRFLLLGFTKTKAPKETQGLLGGHTLAFSEDLLSYLLQDPRGCGFRRFTIWARYVIADCPDIVKPFFGGSPGSLWASNHARLPVYFIRESVKRRDTGFA
jgi:hypothetical protein